MLFVKHWHLKMRLIVVLFFLVKLLAEAAAAMMMVNCQQHNKPTADADTTTAVVALCHLLNKQTNWGNRTLESKWVNFGIQPQKGNSPLFNFAVKPHHLFNPGFLWFIVVFDNEQPQKRIHSLVFVKSLTSHIFCLGTALCNLPANCTVNAHFFWCP